MKLSAGFILFFLLAPLFSRDVFSQDFSSIDRDMALLEDLINSTLNNTAEQQKLLEDLKLSLNKSETLIGSYERIIQEQESLLASLRVQLNEMSETYKTQSRLSARYAQNSKFWRNFTLIAIPVTALISGTVTYAVVK